MAGGTGTATHGDYDHIAGVLMLPATKVRALKSIDRERGEFSSTPVKGHFPPQLFPSSPFLLRLSGDWLNDTMKNRSCPKTLPMPCHIGLVRTNKAINANCR